MQAMSVASDDNYDIPGPQCMVRGDTLENTCLSDSFRNAGVRMARISGPHRVITDGRAMLAPFGLSIIPVPKDKLYQNGRYIVASGVPRPRKPSACHWSYFDLQAIGHAYLVGTIDGMTMKADADDHQIWADETVAKIVSDPTKAQPYSSIFFDLQTFKPTLTFITRHVCTLGQKSFATITMKIVMRGCDSLTHAIICFRVCFF
jgi:hypothetical protein